MGLNITKVVLDDYVKTGKGIEAFSELYTAYTIRYSPYAKRYTINIYGKKFSGIGVEGLVDAMRQVCELGLKIQE